MCFISAPNTFDIMNAKRILAYLSDIAANNNREWFHEHHDEFEVCHKDFLDGVGQLIERLAKFDSEIAAVKPEDCVYRFYRDVRFSPDKSPYKRHFGAYICSHGRKALRGGYYLHLQPGMCFFGIGCYWLPTNILTSVRNEIMGNIGEWRRVVENGKFINTFGYPNEGIFTEESRSEKGFGLAALKTCPKGFPKDYEFMKYLRMKDYLVWRALGDDFSADGKWLDRLAEYAQTAKPMMDFVNCVVDDYE